MLGPLEVWTDSGRIGLAGTKQSHILAALLLADDRVVSVERLVEAAWTGPAPDTAVTQVRKFVGGLRRQLGEDVIITERPGYRLVTAVEQLDLKLFDRRIAKAVEAIDSGDAATAISHLELGLDQWRGLALYGLGGPVLGPVIVQLEERRLAASEQLVDLRLSSGAAMSVLSELRALVDRHPFRENLRRQLMTALYVTGRQAEALQVFADTRRLLNSELGVEPGQALQQLHERILRGEDVLDVRPARPETVLAGSTTGVADQAVRPNTLPYSPSDFTGRTEELARIVEAGASAVEQGPTVVTVEGMAGVGKTSLALHGAQLIADQFPDGQLFVDLRGHVQDAEPTQPMEALAQLLQASGARGERIPPDLAARSAMWRMWTARKRLLLVLDDAVDVNQVMPLLPGTGSCLVLVTTRDRGVDVDGTTRLTLQPMSDKESISLLGKVIGAGAVNAARAGVAELVDICGRLPLALRIAASRLRNRPMWTIDDLVTQLRSADQRLDELVVGDRSVASAIETTYRRLPPGHQRMFRRVAITPGREFDADVAAAVARTTPSQAKQTLEDLVDAQLLSQPRTGRYAIHNLLRDFALKKRRAEEASEQCCP